MISVVSTVHKRDVALWFACLVFQTAKIHITLVVYDDNIEIPKGLPFEVDVINVASTGVSQYPEAWLKNIGIKNAKCDTICCTNIDILYSADFLLEVEERTTLNTLVQATRLNTPAGTRAIVTDDKIELVSETQSMSVILDPIPSSLRRAMATGDCQSMTRTDWYDLGGYNEMMTGWGGLDTELECRAIMIGKGLHMIGYNEHKDGRPLTHMHLWHPQNMDKTGREAQQNSLILKHVLLSGNMKPNKGHWGEQYDGHNGHNANREHAETSAAL